MVTGKPMCLSLTGQESHKVTLPAGQGSFSIGTTGLSEGKYDVWVDKELPISWNAFDGLFVPAGYHWPRFFGYSGNDMGFIDWASKRPIEDFHWWPQENTSIDLSKASINKFFLHTEKNKIGVSTGDKIRFLSLSGNLENIDIKKCTTVPYLCLSPLCSKTETRPYRLPVYKSLEKATSVDISVSPNGQAFDCESLLQFSNLTTLDLSGNLANLEALAELKHIETIGLRYVPDLSNMPNLTTWKSLKSFIGWNIEETAGKLLRTELKELLKNKEMDYSSVSHNWRDIEESDEYLLIIYDQFCSIQGYE